MVCCDNYPHPITKVRTMQDEQPRERLARLPKAMDITGLGRTSFLDKVRKGEIAAPLRLTARAVAWKESDLMAWINSRPVATRRGRTS
jgi:prophage regulatory protein